MTPVSSKTAAVPSQLKWTGYNPAPISALINLTSSIVPETTAPRAEPLNLVKAVSVPPASQHETVQYKIVHAHLETKNKRQLKEKREVTLGLWSLRQNNSMNNLWISV